jgi:hypothetical protein
MSNESVGPLMPGDKSGLIDHLTTLLQHRRCLAPWPLSWRETHLLWWPEPMYEKLMKLRDDGGYHETFPDSHNLVLTVGVNKRTPPLNIDHRGMVSYNNNYTDRSKGLLISGTPSCEKFVGWYQKASIIHAWDQRIIKLLRDMMNDCKTWAQLHKTFPEMFQLMNDWAGIRHRYGTGNSHPTKLAEEAMNDPSRARTETSAGVRDDLKKLSSGVIAVLKQAHAQNPDMRGKLDHSKFCDTWFI